MNFHAFRLNQNLQNFRIFRIELIYIGFILQILKFCKFWFRQKNFKIPEKSSFSTYLNLLLSEFCFAGAGLQPAPRRFSPDKNVTDGVANFAGAGLQPVPLLEQVCNLFRNVFPW